MMDISVVIPVYKAEGCLLELYRRLVAALEQITPDFEIILVEDCGGDRSWEIIAELAQADPRVKGIQLSRNFGQHHAITAGLDRCDGDWVVVMDCDLQDQPEEILHLYAKAQEGFDVVRARRGQRKDPLFKRMTSWLFYKVFNYLAEAQYDGQVGNFRIVSRKVVEVLRQMREQTRGFTLMVDWVGFPTASIDVCHAERLGSRSTYTWSKLFRLAINIVIAHSDKPLRLAVKLGFLMAFCAFLYGFYIVARSLACGSPIVGWSSLIVSMYFLGGLIVTLLGVIGIYLGKTFDETKHRPLYVVRQTTVFAAPSGCGWKNENG
ncbi:MAG: glycosyltransferase family 2 protein [bacterium]|nr:glycosyltransferase family 2 protein [bacterium]